MFISEYKCKNCNALFRKITVDKSDSIICPGCGRKDSQLKSSKELKTGCSGCPQCPGCH